MSTKPSLIHQTRLMPGTRPYSGTTRASVNAEKPPDHFDVKWPGGTLCQAKTLSHSTSL